jgi:hypothetical protein
MRSLWILNCRNRPTRAGASRRCSVGFFSEIAALGLILAGLSSLLSCNGKPPVSSSSRANPIMAQVEETRSDRREVARLFLANDMKLLDEAMAHPSPSLSPQELAIPTGSVLALIQKAAGGWSKLDDFSLSGLEAASVKNVRTIVAIRETERSEGTYITSDGKPTGVSARRIEWDVRILSWPNSEILAAAEFLGGAPSSIIGGNYGGVSVGSAPVGETIQWLLTRINGPNFRPAGRSEIQRLAFLGPSGKVALLGWDVVTIWDPASGKDEKAFSVRGASHKLTASRLKDLEREGISKVAITDSLVSSPDGLRIAVGGRDDVEGKARAVTWIWDAATGRELAEIPSGNEPVFSPDGKLVAVVSVEHGISVWNSEHGTEVVRFLGSEGRAVANMGFTSDGASVWAALPGGTIELWIVSSGKRNTSIKSGSQGIEKAAFAVRSNTAITLEEQGTFPNTTVVTRRWDFTSGTASEALTWPGSIILGKDLAIEPGGTKAAYLDFGGVVIFEPESQRLIRHIAPLSTFGLHGGAVFSPDGRQIALVYRDGAVELVALD